MISRLASVIMGHSFLMMKMNLWPESSLGRFWQVQMANFAGIKAITERMLTLLAITVETFHQGKWWFLHKKIYF
jgi:hypothetical protein